MKNTISAFILLVVTPAVWAGEVVPSGELPKDHTIREVTVVQFDPGQGVDVLDGILRRHVHGQQGAIAVFEIKKGARVPKHQHPNEQISCITKGLVEVIDGGVKHRVAAGQVIVLPPNVPHEFLALEDTTDIDLFAPPRGDWQSGNEPYSQKTVTVGGHARGELAVFAKSPDWLPNGVAVTTGDRKFVSLPRWTDDDTPGVGEILADGGIVPYPGGVWNAWAPGDDPAKAFVSVNAVWSDGGDTLWVVDSGRPRFGKVVPGAAKLVAIDIKTNTVVANHPFDATFAPEGSYMNDMRVRDGWAYLSESGLGAFVVVELATGKTSRFLEGHPATQADPALTPKVSGVEFRTAGGMVPRLHLNDITLSPDGAVLYFQPSAGPNLMRIPTQALRDALLTQSDPAPAIETVGPSQHMGGMEMTGDGTLYVSNLEHGALWKRTPSGEWSEVAGDPKLQWPDALGFGADGSIYIPAAQAHHLAVFSRRGRSELEKPYLIFRYRPRD